MISKTIPYTPAKVSPSGVCLELPADCRFEGANEVFVWREKTTGNVILSANPPPVLGTEFFRKADSSSPKHELSEAFNKFFRETYLEPIRRRRKSKSTTSSLRIKNSAGK